jgi:peptidoglycan/xylan/chitin deacetylase (PgdA/CDA1 family)
VIAPLAYRVMVASGWARRRRRDDAATIFSFHNVVDDGDGGCRGDAALHVGVTRFAAYLDFIASVYTVAPLPEIVARLAAGRTVAGLAALTFDDGCTGFFTHALPLLRGRGLPSAAFLVSGAAERPEPFWWDVLAEAGRLSDAARTRALTDLAGEGHRVLAELGPDGGPPVALPATLLPAPWPVIAAALSDDLTIGIHTATHPNLTAATVDAHEEMARCRAQIGERLGRDATIVAYPYGCSDARVRDAARAAGMTAGLSVAQRRARAGDDALALPRIGVPASLSVDALACWAVELRPRR